MRGIGERFESWFGIQHLRCRECGYRYTDQPLRWPVLAHARCPKCANMVLRDWQEKYYLPPAPVRALTYIGWKQQRCESCRHNFVSLRPRWKLKKKNGSK
jgi:hypothetical protein